MKYAMLVCANILYFPFREAQAYTYSSKSTYGSVFGLPLVVSVPRKGCSYQTLRSCILKHCTRYVKIPPAHPWNEELQKRETTGMERRRNVRQVCTLLLPDLMQEGSQSETTDGDLDNKSMKKLESEDSDGNLTAENRNESDWNDNQPSNNEKQDGHTQHEQHPDKNEGNVDGDEETKEMDIDKDAEEEHEDLFALITVNSYGSQEVKRFANDGSLLQLNSERVLALSKTLILGWCVDCLFCCPQAKRMCLVIGKKSLHWPTMTQRLLR